MNVDIVTVGGYETTGARNMTAVRVGGDVVVFDMGIDLGRILLHDDVEMERMHSLDLIDMGAIPDDRVMSDIEGEVQAIVFSHGHLDHVGAVGKLAHRYDAPIIATPFTAELVEDQLADEETFERDNEVVRLSAGGSTSLSENVDLEFVDVTHSIPDAVSPVLHTPEGKVVYGLDKRLDHTPVVGDPIDMERFRELSTEGEGVLCYLEDCTNANRNGRTPSEAVARRHLRDVLTSMADYDGGILATTFASHVARVKSLVEFAREIGREPVLLGRSMDSYSSAAQRTGVVDFPDDVQSYGRYPERQRVFNRIMDDGKGEYLPIVTGHQGEPRAMLARIARGESPYELDEGDRVVFAARVIPEPTNEAQRHQLDTLLEMQGARVYDDVHVSGHLAREGQYEMLGTLEPEHLIPAHGGMERRERYVELAESQGYTHGRDLHVPRNGEVIELVD